MNTSDEKNGQTPNIGSVSCAPGARLRHGGNARNLLPAVTGRERLFVGEGIDNGKSVNERNTDLPRRWKFLL